MYTRELIIGSVKYYAIIGNAKPVELKAIVQLQSNNNSNINNGSVNATNPGLVRPAGNQVTINGTNAGNITGGNSANQVPANNLVQQNPAPTPVANNYNTGTTPKVGGNGVVNTPTQPVVGTTITR